MNTEPSLMNTELARDGDDFWSRIQGEIIQEDIQGEDAQGEDAQGEDAHGGDIQGRTSPGAFQLGELLEADGATALYATGSAEAPKAVRIYRADELDAGAVLERIEAIAQLSHPNLIAALAAGQASLQGSPVVFLVMERAEENLGSVLRERPLSADEAREVAAPAAEALAYVHGHGWLHGDLRPANIFASGDTLKISSEGLVKVGEAPADSRRSVYDAPEMGRGVRTEKGDVWSLGVTLLEAVTQHAPEERGDGSLVVPEGIAEPLGSILRSCVETDPEKRTTPAGILRQLRGVPAMEERRQPGSQEGARQEAARLPRDLSRAERIQRVPSERVPSERVPSERVPNEQPVRRMPLEPAASERNPRKWILIGIVSAAAIVGIVAGLLPKTTRPVPAAAPAIAAPPAAVPAASVAPAVKPVTNPAADKPSPMTPARATVRAAARVPAHAQPSPVAVAPASHRTPAATGRKADSWYVVVATYSQKSAADKRAREITKRWSRFQAEVFEPPVADPHHLVVIGRNLSEDNAEAMRLRALAAGLPQDVYIKRFPRN